jgi:hypothetical protein
MTLPASHSEADARLAERIGRALELEEVHVFWTLPNARLAAGPELAVEPEAAGGFAGAIASMLGRLLPQRR